MVAAESKFGVGLDCNLGGLFYSKLTPHYQRGYILSPFLCLYFNGIALEVVDNSASGG